MKAVLLTVATALTLTACSNGNNSASTSKTDSTANVEMDTTYHMSDTTNKVADTTKH